MSGDTVPAPEAQEVLFLHYRIIERTGGAHGVRDVDTLRTALARPHLQREGRDLYPTVYDKAAVLMHALATGAPFADGNKRTALAAAGLVLARAGAELRVARGEALETVRRLAQGEVSFRDAALWLRRCSRQRGARGGARDGGAEESPREPEEGAD